MHGTLSPDTKANLHTAHVENVFNKLIPKRALLVKVEPFGVTYLHPTKGYRTIGKKRFAVRGVS